MRPHFYLPFVLSSLPRRYVSSDTAIGAPECYAPYIHDSEKQASPNVNWAADIWSLGCVFSEAAMWIADGYKGLVEYRRQRTAETDRILFRSSDGFHDGERVLQSVLDCHKDIEDRLRRSDFITKDVLDAMVDEMLWEEDRPNAKALIRKADMVLLKARNRLSGDQFPRPGSSQGRHLPRHAPPTAPLPPIPRGLTPGLASIAERRYLPNVENWRSQVTGSQISAPATDVPGLSSFRQTAGSTVGSVSDLDRELNGSIASWQLGDNNSTASPITPFTSPHVSVYYDQNRQAPNEGRPRVFRSQSNNSGEYRKPPNPLQYARSYVSHTDTVTSEPMMAPPSVRPDAYTHDEETLSFQQAVEQMDPNNRNSVLGDLRRVDEPSKLGRAGSRASSRHSSSGYSTSTRQSIHQDSHPNELNVPSKSQKRLGGFSLFPSKTREASPLPQSSEAIRPAEKKFFGRDRNNSTASVPRSNTSLPSNAGILSSPAEASPGGKNLDFLSLNTCLEWKKAHKKVKKSSQVPPLPGAESIEGLKGRDHVCLHLFSVYAYTN